MRWRILNMADDAAYSDVFDPLRKVAEVVSMQPDQQTLVANIAGFDGYFSSLQVQMTSEVLSRATRLRVIATPATGMDNIDLATARARGVTILSIREEREFLNTVTATAEQTWALLLATVRRLPWAFEAARMGRWQRDPFLRGHQLSGKTLGILGYSRLGTIVADYGLAFRMRVLACDVRDVTPSEGVTMVDFETLLRESDILSIHVHLSEKTRGLVDAHALRKMKKGAVLINTSRGAIIDEAALHRALASGSLGGAGLDVLQGEYGSNLGNHPLVQYARKHQNLVLTPHIGGVTLESQRMTRAFMVDKLVRHIQAQDDSASAKPSRITDEA